MSRGIIDIITNKQDRVEVQRNEMYTSLMNAVSQAGGNVRFFSDKVLYGKITVAELIDYLGQSGIRFIYKDKK